MSEGEQGEELGEWGQRVTLSDTDRGQMQCGEARDGWRECGACDSSFVYLLERELQPL